MNPGDRVQLRNALVTVTGGSHGAGTEYTVWRRFETSRGDRLALMDGDRIVLPCVPVEQVESVLGVGS
jgi:hypothetical protein